jgi:hypothetical protein
VLELHGNLREARCTGCAARRALDGDGLPLREIDHSCGGRMRPAIVWFGEPLPQREWVQAQRAAERADVILAIGTSAVVYPAAALAAQCARGAFVAEINPEATAISERLDCRIRGTAARELPRIFECLVPGSVVGRVVAGGMDSLEFLKGKISDFPGYGDDDLRRTSDELIRSYLGEAIADLEVRLAPTDGGLRQRIGDLLIRVGFANQHVYRTYQDNARARSEFGSIADADANVVQTADRAASIGAAQLPAYLDEIVGALDRRDAAMSGSAPAVTP